MPAGQIACQTRHPVALRQGHDSLKATTSPAEMVPASCVPAFFRDPKGGSLHLIAFRFSAGVLTGDAELAAHA